MEPMTPFGSGVESDIPVQKFMGCTVSTFNCSADFASQPGSCTITLVQDDSEDEFNPGIIGSPQFFKIVDNKNNIIFKYNGIVDSISRSTDSSNKKYTVNLTSPLKILESVTVILDGYTGYGQTEEGLPKFFSEDGYYYLQEENVQDNYMPDGVTMTPSVNFFQKSPYSFSSNNRAIPWDKVFNLLNPFGFFENENIQAVPFSGYGAASSNKGKMRVDKVAYALHQLINNTNSDSDKRYLGGNIIYGTNTYNVCGTAAGYVPPIPFYYGFDIIGFVQYLINYLPESFALTGPSMTLAEIVASVCDAVNADFMVELNDATYNNGQFMADLKKTYPLTTFGGIISVTLIPRNEFVNCNRPFNQFTYDLINLERPDMGDYQYSGKINPGVFQQAVGLNANNPFDIDFINKGTEGSYPYGGKFPVGIKSDSRGITYDGVKAENVEVSLKASSNTVAKMVVGGYQSRMSIVPRDFIYQYWGEITLGDAVISATGINSSSQKAIPVITQVLPPNDTWDWVAIDCQSIFGPATVPGILYRGIYFASMMEIRAAINGENEWNRFLATFKFTKNKLFDQIYSVLLNITARKYYSVLNNFHQKSGNTVGNPNQNFLPNRKASARNLIYEKVKTIGETHYGKSWIAPIPACRTMATSNDENLVGGFERSWQVVDDAYVEPYVFDSIEAPKDSRFINNGRLKAYVNFEHMFPSSGNVGYDLITKTLTGTLNTTLKYDFSEYEENAVYDFNQPMPETDENGIPKSGSYNAGLLGLAHVEPNNIQKQYLYISPSYFTIYNRGKCPFIDTIDQFGILVGPNYTGVVDAGTFYCYSYGYSKRELKASSKKTGGIPKAEYLSSVVNDPNNKTFFSDSVVKNLMDIGLLEIGNPSVYKEPRYEDQSSSIDWTISEGSWSWVNTACFDQNFNWISAYNSRNEILSTGYIPYFSWMHTGSAMNTVLNNLYMYQAKDNGDGLPYVRFETNRVFYPETISKDGFDPLSEEFLDNISKKLNTEIQIRGSGLSVKRNSQTMNTAGFRLNTTSMYKPCVSPRSIAIPQQSNRYTYGPWMTKFDGIIYGGRFEYEQNLDLVPENYMIPIYGKVSTNWNILDKNGNVKKTIESVNGTVISGIAGMNLAGQAIANSIDNFSLFAQEEGTITLPGLPIIQTVGKVLINGPRITDISISFDNNKISTTYNFRALSPRFGKSNKELLQNIRKVSNTVKSGIKK